MAVDCQDLFWTLKEKGIVNSDFYKTLKSLGINKVDIEKDFDGFLLSLKTNVMNASQLTKGNYLSNVKANEMLDKFQFYTHTKGDNVSKTTASQAMSTDYALMRKATNEQKSILWGETGFGKEFTDSNGSKQLFASYVEANNLHSTILDNLMNNKALDGIEKDAAGILDNFKRHIDTEASNLVGTKKLNTANMVKTEYIYSMLDEAKLKFHDMNQTTKIKKSALKFLRGDSHVDVDPKKKGEFMNFLMEEFEDIVDLDKNSPENLTKFFDDYYFAKAGRSNLGGMKDYNIFDNMDKTKLFSEKFNQGFMENPIEYSKYNINSVDVIEAISKRWSRNYGIYDRLGSRPFETLDTFLAKGKNSLDNTTYGNVKNLIEKNYVGGLVEELKLSTTSVRSISLDAVNTVGNLVLAPRLLAFGLVNVDDIPMRSILTSSLTGDSALKRSFLDNKSVLGGAVKDFILDIGFGKSAFEKNALNSLAEQQQGNLARILSGNNLDGMPRYNNRFKKTISELKDAYNQGGASKALTAVTGSNLMTLGNDSLEKAMVFNSNDISMEIMGRLKKTDFDPQKAFLTSDAMKRNGITDKMLEIYRKSDNVSNAFDDVSLPDIMETMKITKENMNFKSIDYLVRKEMERELTNKGVLNKGGILTGNQKDAISNRIMDFYMKTKGEDKIPESIMELINNTADYDFISNGGEIAVRAKKGNNNKFNIVREKELEKNFNTAYKQLIEHEGSNVRRSIETKIKADLESGNPNKMVESFNKSLNESRYKKDIQFSEMVDSQRGVLNERFDNLQYTLFEDHFGLFSSSYDSANVLNDLARMDPKLAIMYRINTFYKATLGRSNNRALKLLNAKLGDDNSLSVGSVWNNKQMFMNMQVADMFVAAVVGNQIINSLKSDLQGNEGFVENMQDPDQWIKSAIEAPYVATPFGYNYSTSLGAAVTAPLSYAKNKVTGQDYFARQDAEKFRKAIFSGTGYNMFDNWVMSNAMETLKPDPELGDPLTEIFAYTSKKYRKDSGYQKEVYKEERKLKNKAKKEGGK